MGRTYQGIEHDPYGPSQHTDRGCSSVIMLMLKKKFSYATILLFVMLGIRLITTNQVMAQPIQDGIAAIVNKEVITISELKNEVRDETVRLRARYEGEALEQRLIQKEYDVLNQMIERRLQLQEASAKGIRVSDAELDQAIEQLRQSQPNIEDSTSRTVLRQEMILRRMFDLEIRRRLIVSPEEVRSYYTQSQEEFTTPVKYHLRQILLKPQVDENNADALGRANGLIKQLQDSKSFTELAQQYSEGTESILGGDLGLMRKDELVGPLAQVLNRLKVGEVSEPVETELGVHILKLEESIPGKPLPFEEVKESIKNTLLQRKTRDMRGKWLSNLKDKSYIEIRF